MAKPTLKALDSGQLDMMWNFLMMGSHRSNIPELKKNLDLLRQAMIQKTAWQRSGDPANYVSFDEIGTICNIIICEAMALYLSGDLDKIGKNMEKEEKKC